jgi:hypothetical protein
MARKKNIKNKITSNENLVDRLEYLLEKIEDHYQESLSEGCTQHDLRYLKKYIDELQDRIDNCYNDNNDEPDDIYSRYEYLKRYAETRKDRQELEKLEKMLLQNYDNDMNDEDEHSEDISNSDEY